MDSNAIAKGRLLRIARGLWFLLLALAIANPAAFLAAEPGAWKHEQGYRWLNVAPGATGADGFRSLPASETGIQFSNTLASAEMDKNRILENGSGIALGDVDGDGLCDIYFCSLMSGNRLYRNLGGWKFEEITSSARVQCLGHPSTGAVFADVDGDGDLDLIVNQIGDGTHVYLNDGHARFRESSSPELLTQKGGHSLALADVDGDGDLDLYVVNYRGSTFKDIEGDTTIRLRNVNGVLQVPPENTEQFMVVKTPVGNALVEVGEPDRLFLNDGRGQFTALSWTNGAFLDVRGVPLSSPPRDWGLSAQFRDMNGDGAPDLYVCNDFFSPDRIWINDGHGRFRAAPRLSIRKTSFASMAVDFADINRDGHDDFIVVEMLNRSHRVRQIQRDNFELDTIPWWGWPTEPLSIIDSQPQVKRNTLFLNRGDDTYAEIAQFSGVQATGWTWGVLFLDVDLDGFEDMLIDAGHPHDATDSDALRRFDEVRRSAGKKLAETTSIFPPLPLPKLAFRNQGDLTFSDQSSRWGFHSVAVSHGMALADLDNDGDLDVVVNSMNGPAELFRNEGTKPRIAVSLKGRHGNVQGIGARVRVLGGPVPQSQEMISGGRYLSGDNPMRVFAAGSATNHLRIEVTWRHGQSTIVSNAAANRAYEIEEPASAVSDSASKRDSSAMSYYENVSGKLKHVHGEVRYDDFEREPLMSRRLSELGPGVSWMDVDGDGWMDLVVGSGRGGRMGVMRNGGDGSFRSVGLPGMTGAVMDDQTTILGWSSEPGQSSVLMGQSHYEQGTGGGVAQYDLFFGDGQTRTVVPMDASSVGPLAVTDWTGEGMLELFVGGRVIPGKYPAAASSRLYRQTAKGWEADNRAGKVLSDIGMVSGALWTDVSGDGQAELVLACEWGAVKVLRLEGGVLKDWDAGVMWKGDWHGRGEGPKRLSDMKGWWTGVTAGDFDGDGRMDLVVGNWGLNAKYREFLKGGLTVYHGDVSADGVYEMVEAYYEPEMKKTVPWRDFKTMRSAIPSLGERFGSYKAYGEASVEEILGEGLKEMGVLTADVLESVVMLNRGDHFECRALPREAQYAPVFGVCVGDYDGDGNEDVYVSQNFFGTDLETGRYDAGRGLWMRGDGKGGFEAVSGKESGVVVYGEQRGAALCDYDGDGRVDLAVSQNGAATQLFHNRRGAVGLRVSAVGKGRNGNGFGAVMRLGDGTGGWGAAREVHAGSGYWSQESAVQVMHGRGKAPSAIQIRWPGGSITESKIPAGAREIRVSADGVISRVR